MGCKKLKPYWAHSPAFFIRLIPAGRRISAQSPAHLSRNWKSVYKTLLEQIPAVVFMAPLEAGLSSAYVSPHIEAVLGFTQEQWLNDPVRWYYQIHPDDRGRWSIEAAALFLTGQPLRSVYRLMARDGHPVWFQCEAKMVRKPDGRPW